LGRHIAEAALKAGDNVVAGARRTEELASLVAQYGERVKPVKLEVREETAAKAAVQLAVDTCFYGVVYTTRAAIPVMRNQGQLFT
jgi:NADP-dependent 3-hydroxy acid dehydrogenase YdfG